MESIGAFEAKTQLSALLEKVAQGESILITKHGKPVARLVPPLDSDRTMTVAEAVSGLLQFRKVHRLSQGEIRSLIAEGRKH